MIAFLATLALRVGVPQRFAKLAAIAGAIIGAVILLCAARALLRELIISRHEAKVEAHAQKAGRAADARAADRRLADAERRHSDTEQLKGTLDATAPDPDARRRAFYDCLSRQRQARVDGQRPPAGC